MFYDAISHIIRYLNKLPLYLVLGTGASIAIFLLAASLFSPAIKVTLAAQNIRLERGHAYVGRIPKEQTGYGVFRLRSDTVGSGTHSESRLLENGTPLNYPHASHESIRTHGAGRYSHWGSRVYFSSSDNTSPRSNGRDYELTGKLTPAPWVYLVGLFIIAATFIRTIPCLSSTNRQRLLRATDFLVTPSHQQHLPAWTLPALAILGLMTGPLAVYLVWRSGISLNLSLAGLLPVSDAAGYFHCASDLVYRDETNGWCHRRPLYSIFLASLMLMLGEDLHLVLLVQAALVTLAIVIFSMEIGRWLGPAFGFAAFAASAGIFYGHALNQTMSETLGLILGLLAASFLLRAVEAKSSVLAFFGLFVLALALNVRPGALFAIPMVLLWLVWFCWKYKKGVWRHMILGLVACALGFAAHAVAVWAIGGDPGRSHGNFALTLYGLSVGGDWASIYKDHPELFRFGLVSQLPSIDCRQAVGESCYNSAIFQLAVHNIFENPTTLLASLWRNLNLYLGSIFLSSVPPLKWFTTREVVMIVLAATTFWGWRDPRALLSLAFILGEVASAPFIAADGGSRIFVVTAPIQILPLLFLGSQLVAKLRTRFRQPEWAAAGTSPTTIHVSSRPWLPFAVLTGVLLLCVLSLTPLRLLTREPARSGASCPPDLDAVITRLRSGGSWLSITSGEPPSGLWPRRVSTREFRQGVNPAHWYAESVQRLPPMKVMLTPQYSQNSYGEQRWLYVPGDNQLPVGEFLLLCVDKSKSRHIAEREFHEVVSHRRLMSPD